jgi:hypothetical protein
MSNEKDGNEKQVNLKQQISRTEKEIQLKNKLLSGPELFITEKGSDEHLDKLALKAKLFKVEEFSIADYVAEVYTKYETKFHRYWYYALADMYQIRRSVMDTWVKPDFVRVFTIQAVYGRFPYMMLRELRKRKINIGDQNNRLYQYLTKNASDQIDIVIAQVYSIMKDSNSPIDFWMAYSREYRVYFQIPLF